jgi:Protein of unknown function (DUF1573)
MKTRDILSFIFAIFIFSACNNGVGKTGELDPVITGTDETAEISFREYEHDFGKISRGEKVAHIFSFENKGPGSLVIKSASTSCGCTVTKFDRKPIPPGQSGSLEVVFDSEGRSGMQTKTVSVNSKNQVVILKITAEIVN